jgi:hypothetical protein
MKSKKPTNNRHCLLLPDPLWLQLVDDAAAQMRRRKESITPAQRAREILEKHLKAK